MHNQASSNTTSLVDNFNRQVDYLRLSVTDRCDLRCVYCMSEKMTFLPRQQLLTLEENAQIAAAFIELGVKKIRLTGGEPLVRENIFWLIEELGRNSQLESLVMTTNGMLLEKAAPRLADAGMSRLNISLDTLDSQRFNTITRVGSLDKVLCGIAAAKQQNFKKLKLNSLIMKGKNCDEVVPLARFAVDNGLDITYIEEMPLGQITEHNRQDSYCSSEWAREQLEQAYSLIPTTENTGGPARYYRVSGSETRIGFISPHSHNFCDTCNRVRLTPNGQLLLCLGHEHSVDLKRFIRSHPGDKDALKEEIIRAVRLKPERHYFDLDDESQVLRFMNHTGG